MGWSVGQAVEIWRHHRSWTWGARRPSTVRPGRAPPEDPALTPLPHRPGSHPKQASDSLGSLLTIAVPWPQRRPRTGCLAGTEGTAVWSLRQSSERRQGTEQPTDQGLRPCPRDLPALRPLATRSQFTTTRSCGICLPGTPFPSTLH